MKSQPVFWEKYFFFSTCHLLEILPSMLSINYNDMRLSQDVNTILVILS